MRQVRPAFPSSGLFGGNDEMLREMEIGEMTEPVGGKYGFGWLREGEEEVETTVEERPMEEELIELPEVKEIESMTPFKNEMEKLRQQLLQAQQQIQKQTVILKKSIKTIPKTPKIPVTTKSKNYVMN